MPLTLYQFPISHYCEKVRFALDYKCIEHRVVNLLPGPHVRKIRGMAQRSSVPLLVTEQGQAIQGSAEIISYLDHIEPQRPLTPANDEQRAQTLRWEYWLDHGLGIEIRRFFYHYLLPERQLTIRLLTHQAPWYGHLMMPLGYGKMANTMRRYMAINEQTAARALVAIKTDVGHLADTYQNADYLVGDRFSRADLAAAALLAPLIQPAAYGLPWPDPLPEALHRTAADLQPQLAWAQRLYCDYRLQSA